VELANSAAGFFSYVTWPRPIGWMFVCLIGHFGIYGSTAIVVLLTILNCALSAALLRRILKIDFRWPLLVAFFIYAYLVFSEPYFYTFYAQDSMSQLSYFFLVIGSMCFYTLHRRSIVVSNLLLFIFTMLAFLSKETYGITALIVTGVWFLYFCRQSVLRAIMPSLIVAGALVLSLGYNVYVNSPFFSSSPQGGAYQFNLSPASIFGEWSRYAREGLNVEHLVVFMLIALACYYYIQRGDRRRVFYIFFGCVIAAICAWIPNALLPEHHFSGYSWNGASILFLPVLLISLCWKRAMTPCVATPNKLKQQLGIRNWILQRSSKQQPNQRSWKGTDLTSGFLAIILLVVCFINPMFNKGDYAKNWWNLAQEDTQRHLLKALTTLIADTKSSTDKEKVLITGLTFPFSPFDQPASLRVFPNAHLINFDVVRYWAFAPRERTENVKLIALSDVNPKDYSQIWVFDNDGHLIRVLHSGDPISKSLLRFSV
jgi:hypothetical protein